MADAIPLACAIAALSSLVASGCGGGGEACQSCGLGAGGAGGTSVGSGGDPEGTGGGAPAGTNGSVGTGGVAGSGAGGIGGNGGMGSGGSVSTGGAGSSGGVGAAGAGGAGASGGAGATGTAGRGGTTGGGGGGTTGAAGGGGGVAGGGNGGGGMGGNGRGGASGGGVGGGTGGSGTGGGGTGGGGTGGGGTGGSGTGGGGTGGSSSGGAGGSGQVVLSIDFIGGRTSMGGTGGAMLVAAPAMASTEVAGVKPVARWNGAANIMGMLASLVLADGTATGASVMWNSPSMGMNPGEWLVGMADAPGNARMMNGYLDPTSASTPATVTVSGLPTSITGAGYDVYVYMTGAVGTGTNMRVYNYSIGTAMFTVTQTGPTPTSFTAFTLAPAGGAGNYVVFRNLTAATFTLTATPGTGDQTRAPVNGLQIVSPAGS